MARAFKISFPLPGRRPNSSPQTTPSSQFSSKTDADNLPLSHPGAKAEKVLGTADGDGNEPGKKEARKDRKNLRNYPGFMSVTLADTDEESVQSQDRFPFPGMLGPNEIVQKSAQGMGRHGSSPLLGDTSLNRPTDADSSITNPRPEPRHMESFSTLRSYYDRAKSPLSVSQQTSSSSARDMALRKGSTPVATPLGHHSLKASKTKDTNEPHSRNTSDETAESKISATSRIAGTPRRRPSVTDPPTLYPNRPPPLHAHAVSPPPALMNQTLPKTGLSSGAQSPTFSRPRWWARRSTKVSPQTPVEEKHDPMQFEANFSSIKVNIKKPKAGAQNWFDYIDEDESTMAELEHPEIHKIELFDQPAQPLTIHEIMAQSPPPPAPVFTTPRRSSLSKGSQHSSISDRKLRFSLASPPVRHPQNGPSSPPSEMRSTPGSPSSRSLRSTQSSGGVIHSGIDLQIQSVLNLSSSDSEGEDDSNAHPLRTYQRHRIRPSIERLDYNTEVHLSSAERIQPSKPKPVVNRLSQRSLSRASNSTSPIPPVPLIPPRPRLSQRTSSMGCRQTLEERSTTTCEPNDSTVSSTSSSIGNSRPSSLATSPPNARRASATRPYKPKIKTSLRASKLMKVTSEEEKLLEAMREKRASIRQDDFQKGFQKALQLRGTLDLDRPKTAGVDGRTSHRSSLCGHSHTSSNEYSRSNGYVGGHGYKVSLAGSRLSASTENLTLEDAYPFPLVPTTTTTTNTKTRRPHFHQKTPSLSFSPSDILPSTPTSRDSPLTPPPLLSSKVYEGAGSGRGESREWGGKGGHERERTVSSSIVMLDGIEVRARELEMGGEGGW